VTHTTYLIDSAEKRREAIDAIRQLTSAKIMQVDIRPTNRTLRQNAAYWGVWLKAIEDATGIQAKAWHEYFKREYVPADIYVINGKRIEVPESTTSMTTAEFSEYLERIFKYAAETLNIQLPEIER
jgi:hypothetical protein